MDKGPASAASLIRKIPLEEDEGQQTPATDLKNAGRRAEASLVVSPHLDHSHIFEIQPHIFVLPGPRNDASIRIRYAATSGTVRLAQTDLASEVHHWFPSALGVKGGDLTGVTKP